MNIETKSLTVFNVILPALSTKIGTIVDYIKYAHALIIALLLFF